MTNAKPAKDHLGREYPSREAMCRAWSVGTGTFYTRARRGYTLEQCLTGTGRTGPGKPCTDHLGNEYPSESDMLRAYGLEYVTYHYRLEKRGWTQQQALETPPGDTDLAGAHECTDHLGNRFPSKRAMCDYWRIPRNVYFQRVKAGKTLEECLAPVNEKYRRCRRTVADHLGGTFSGLDEMCAAWGISKEDYIQNIRNGLPLDRALTERTERPDRPKDHKGNEYPSLNAMCRAYGIDKTVLRSRLELGWTLRQILENPQDGSRSIECTDHLGRKYATQVEMLAAWNVTYATFTHRKAHGRSLQECLDPGSLKARPHTDHLGNTFPCLAAMREYWHVLAATYHDRTDRRNLPPEDALNVLRKDGRPAPGVFIADVLGNGRYAAVDYRDRRIVLTKDGLHVLLCRLSMLDAIASGTLPEGMSARHVTANWFEISLGDRDGTVPRILPAEEAWKLACMVRYAPKEKISVPKPKRRKPKRTGPVRDGTPEQE